MASWRLRGTIVELALPLLPSANPSHPLHRYFSYQWSKCDLVIVPKTLLSFLLKLLTWPDGSFFQLLSSTPFVCKPFLEQFNSHSLCIWRAPFICWFRLLSPSLISFIHFQSLSEFPCRILVFFETFLLKGS